MPKGRASWFDNHRVSAVAKTSYTISPSVDFRPPSGMRVLYHTSAPRGEKSSFFSTSMASGDAPYISLGFTALWINKTPFLLLYQKCSFWCFSHKNVVYLFHVTHPKPKAGASWFDNRRIPSVDGVSYTISPSVNSRSPSGICILYHTPAPCRGGESSSSSPSSFGGRALYPHS